MEKQYVVFKLGEEYFGLAIEMVESIIKPQAITKLPLSYEFIEGIINLRGEIIPIMSLHRKFNLTDDEINPNTRYIITRKDRQLTGFIVDQVDEVIHLDTEKLNDVPEIATSIDHHFIQAVANEGERIIILLDLAEILSNKVFETV